MTGFANTGILARQASLQDCYSLSTFPPGGTAFVAGDTYELVQEPINGVTHTVEGPAWMSVTFQGLAADTAAPVGHIYLYTPGLTPVLGLSAASEAAPWVKPCGQFVGKNVVLPQKPWDIFFVCTSIGSSGYGTISVNFAGKSVNPS